MTYRAGIIGASGYTGAELLRLLATHAQIDVVVATADTNAGVQVGDLYPSLSAAYPNLKYVPIDPEAFASLDVVFVALPHGASQKLMPELVASIGHVVDLGADFRLPADTYQHWYGTSHAAPDLLNSFAFGLPELFRSDIQDSKHVANPGCYPTASSLALAPLLANGLVERSGIIVDAMSGHSGAGRALKMEQHFAEADEGVSAYGLLTHRHTAEIEFALAHVAAHPVEVFFTPHLVPMIRGIQATCHARPAKTGLSTESLQAAYRDFYSAEPFVVVSDNPTSTKAATGANTCHVTVRFDERTNSVLALGVIDNLVKGASGQAIQNANLLLGLPEATGLPHVGMWP